MKINHHSVKIFLIFLLTFIFSSSARQHQQVYIVYLGEHNELRSLEEIEGHHHSYLYAVKGSLEEAKSSVVYSYTKVINGFAAFLTPQEADAISEMDGVISVFKDRPHQLDMSRSWNETSLLDSDWDHSATTNRLECISNTANDISNVVIGVFDSGIWPESESFNDRGMDPPPSTWKGICQEGDRFQRDNCNGKLIGARYYVSGYEAAFGPVNPNIEFRSPRDKSGHGTHVASIATGRILPDASAVGGFGKGTVRGVADLARLAVYKVCWVTPTGGSACFDSDLLAAFDHAIYDGVDLISVSISPSTTLPFDLDIYSIGALHAVKWDILVSYAAGNSGPTAGTVRTVAPWVITVGASSTNRMYSSTALLGNGYTAQGQSVSVLQEASYHLAFDSTTGSCLDGTLSPEHAKGKAIFCLRGATTSQVLEVQRAGGVAAILENPEDGIQVQLTRYPIPTTVVLQHERQRIIHYIRTTATPIVKFTLPRTLTGIRPSPFMAGFSSRGPVSTEPNILKPNVVAPGLNILAANTEANNPPDKFVFLSGTSMACPYVTGVAATLKAKHPSWSEAAIRSAIMTTASVTNNLGTTITDASLNLETPFAYGSGDVQLSKAADPGLIYDTTYNDYLLFLCASIGDSSSYRCPTTGIPPQSNMNYPSLSIADVQGVMRIPRKVTNVGTGSATYSVTIDPPKGYSVQISPARLQFTASGQTLDFTIVVQAQKDVVRNQYIFGSYTWSDGTHTVRSPIVLYTSGDSINTPLNDQLCAGNGVPCSPVVASL